MAALYDRSLKLAAAAYPWLLAGHQPARTELDPAGLCTALGLQSPASARAAAEAVFSAFHGLLQSLVGPALTERLLQPVWAPPPPAPPVQDPTP